MTEEQFKELVAMKTEVRNRYNGGKHTFMGINVDGTCELSGLTFLYPQEVFLDSFEIIETNRYKGALNYFNNHIEHATLYGQKEAYKVAIEIIHKLIGEGI